MATRGYIKVDRAALNHPLFKRTEYSEFEAWIWLLAEAAWRPEQRRAGDYLVSVDRGQLVASVRFLASAWSWDRNRVERFVKRLKNQDMIETRTETGISIITICNYNKYQGDEEEIETPLRRDARQMRDTSETDARQMRDNKKETNKPSSEETKKEYISPRPSGACTSDGDDQDSGRSTGSPSPSDRRSQAASSAPDGEATLPLGGELILPEPQSGARAVAVSAPRAPRRGGGAGGEHPQFAEWWAQYPLKKGRKEAAKRYGQIVAKGEASPEALLAGAMRYAAERSRQDPRYTKHPTTWLNQGCWADESPPAVPRRSAADDFMAGIKNYLTVGD